MPTMTYFRSGLLLTALSFSLLAGQTAQAQWSQYQGNAAHTGYVPETVGGNYLTAGWNKTFLYNGQPTTHSDIVVSSQGVFTSEYQKPVTINGDSFFYQYGIVALDKATGQEQWTNSVLIDKSLKNRT